MRSGTVANQGDIVPVPIPFTDLTSSRRRPVIVISNDQYNQTVEDMMVEGKGSADTVRADAPPCFAAW
jgi:mRNA-degrading endonuclease toxin of MazEF toxin-antitoxin module